MGKSFWFCFASLSSQPNAAAALRFAHVSYVRTYLQCDRLMGKKLPNFPQYWPKSSQIIFYMKVTLFKTAQKFTRIFGLFLWEIFITKKVKNRPIWSHCAYLPNPYPFFLYTTTSFHSHLNVEWEIEKSVVVKIATGVQ